MNFSKGTHPVAKIIDEKRNGEDSLHNILQRRLLQKGGSGVFRKGEESPQQAMNSEPLKIGRGGEVARHLVQGGGNGTAAGGTLHGRVQIYVPRDHDKKGDH